MDTTAPKTFAEAQELAKKTGSRTVRVPKSAFTMIDTGKMEGFIDLDLSRMKTAAPRKANEPAGEKSAFIGASKKKPTTNASEKHFIGGVK